MSILYRSYVDPISILCQSYIDPMSILYRSYVNPMLILYGVSSLLVYMVVVAVFIREIASSRHFYHPHQNITSAFIYPSNKITSKLSTLLSIARILEIKLFWLKMQYIFT